MTLQMNPGNELYEIERREKEEKRYIRMKLYGDECG